MSIQPTQGFPSMNQLTNPRSTQADEEDTRSKAQKLAEAREQLTIAFNEGDEHIDNAFQSALVVGHWANKAREAMDNPSEEFKAWFEKCFGEKTKRPRSIQQVYKCMGAAQAWECLPTGKKAREAIFAKHGKTIKSLYGLRLRLQNGDDVTQDPDKPKAKRGAPTKAERAAKAAAETKAETKAAKADKDTDNGEGANELAAEAQRLAKLAKQLDLKAKRLDKMEEDLNERERLLKIREARLPAGVNDAEVKPEANATQADTSAQDGEAALEATRAKFRRKSAPSKAASAAVSAAKDPADTTGTPEGEKAPEATQADLAERAQRTVAEDYGTADIDNIPPVGDSASVPDGSSDQPGGAF